MSGKFVFQNMKACVFDASGRIHRNHERLLQHEGKRRVFSRFYRGFKMIHPLLERPEA
jgi:hypothetical protein